MRKHRIGDIVEQRGRKIKITTMGKRVTGIDVETGKKVFVK
jgi:NMD protein affecting ribosome stability and mRNA decay